MGKADKIILAVLLALLAVSVCFNIRQCSTREVTYQDTIRTTFVDTVPFYEPVPRDSVVVRYVTEILPVVSDTCNIDMVNIPGSGNIAGDFIHDSVKVAIPISSKVYEDSAYTAYVSGYRVSLDSLFIYPRERTFTVTRTVPVCSPSRWSVGLQLGAGVGPGGCGPYLGIGVSYRLFPR